MLEDFYNINLNSFERGFAFNHLKGSIPETISNLENLHTLHLGGNNLSGILSPSLGFLKSMAYL